MAGLVGGLSLLVACADARAPQAREWRTYENPRYGFAFLYPNDWKAVPLEAGIAGQRFEDPHNPHISMSGWASERSDEGAALNEIPDMTPNLQTEQGRAAILRVRIEQEVSRMELTVLEAGVIYRWEGRSPTDLFDEHYRFFDYVARRYAIAPPDANQEPPK